MRKSNLLKKVCASVLAVSMVTLTACSGSGTTAATTAAPAAPAAETTAAAAEAGGASEGTIDMSGTTLNFWSDKVGSGTYNMIVAMSKVLEEKGGFGTVNVDPSYPGGMGAPYIFKDPNVSLSFVNGAPAKWAMETGTLDREPTDGYAAVIGGLTAVAYINCISTDFLTKNNVTSLEEIFEKKLPLRIGCSSKGSMDAEGAYLMLEYFGVTEDDLKSWGGSITNQGGDQNAEAIADGQIDFYIDHTSSSSSTMAQIASTCDVTFLQWSEDMCNWFVNDQGFDLIPIPAGSFKGQDAELKLPGSPDCLFANTALDDDTVYMIVKTLSENRDALVTEYASLSPWEPENAWEETKRGGVALHPGAERYYKEMGYMK
ncbi:MAG: TAXI family TRAP transporter solute-binding subunit [Lachnospiraceae bacterium]|nr:TAXI family TRAP transporter solute-binding subunit [Lachnospiraceae bacterium]